VADNVERVFANIDADYDDRALEFLGHGVLLVFGAPSQHSMPVGREHGRTIPLTDIGPSPAATLCALWDEALHLDNLFS